MAGTVGSGGSREAGRVVGTLAIALEARLEAFPYRPLNFAGRFSKKAATPSLASSLASAIAISR